MFTIKKVEKPFVLSVIIMVIMAIGQSEAKEQIWEGPLYQSSGGEIELGYVIEPMGWEAGYRGSFLAEDLANRLKHFVIQKPVYLACEQEEWIGIEGKQVGTINIEEPKTPLVLVRLKGEVIMEGREYGYRSVMTEGNLLSVEFISEEWLRKDQELVKLGFHPWGGLTDEKIEQDKNKVQKLSKKALPILLEMKKYSNVTKALQEEVKKVEPRARAVKSFQAHTEGVVHRWLVTMNQKYGFNLKDIERLGNPPPTQREIQEWFISASTKKDFLDKVQSCWKGDLYELLVYGEEPIILGEAFNTWTEDDFKRHQTRAKESIKYFNF